MILSVAKEWPRVAWSLFTLTVSLVILDFAPMIIRRVRALYIRWRDDRTARRVWPEVVILVQRFGPFVDSSRGDTIHAVARDANYPGGGDLVRALQTQSLVPLESF